MKKIFPFFLVVALLITANAFAQSQIFIKATGNTGLGNTGQFDGGSKDAAHQNEIEALAYSDGLAGCTTSFTTGANTTCKVSPAQFSFTMPLSLAVNSFRYNLLRGTKLASVVVMLEKTGGETPFEYYRITMEEVQVNSLSEGTSSELPFINVTIQPARVTWTIVSQKEDGTAGTSFTTSWDFRRNAAF